MQSLNAFHVINGKAVLSADAIVGVCKRRTDVCLYFRLVEATDEVASFETLRAGDPEPTRMSYSIKQAQRAGLTSSATWKKHTEAMLMARCKASLARAVYPDLVGGLYDTDEGREIAGGLYDTDEGREIAGEYNAPRNNQQHPQKHPQQHHAVERRHVESMPAVEAVKAVFEDAVVVAETPAEPDPRVAIIAACQGAGVTQQQLDAWLKATGYDPFEVLEPKALAALADELLTGEREAWIDLLASIGK